MQINMKNKVKTIDINALQWFDKVNGNSYFAGTIIVNYQMPTERRFVMPFQYGYGEQYVHEAASVLDEAGVIKLPKYANGSKGSLWQYCNYNKIITRQSKQTNCKKAELKAIN